MKVVYAPNYHYPIPAEKSLYLAGGVSGCPDWQAEVIKALEKTTLTIFNPRRQLPASSFGDLQSQREWEFGNITKVLSVMFWFPKESLCPSTNFELGMAAMSSQHVLFRAGFFVGIHPQHSRRSDIIAQLNMTMPKLVVVDSVKGLVQQVKNALKKGEIK